MYDKQFFQELSDYINTTDYSSYTLQYPPPFISDAYSGDTQLIQSFSSQAEIGLYIHVPFCDTKCTFCRYFSFVEHKEEAYEKYVKYLKKELELYKRNVPKINSLYIGGGTPSILSYEQLDDILWYVFSTFQCSSDFQFCFESNPSSLSKEKIELLHTYGCHRLTIGVQSMDDQVLKKINRFQTRRHVISAILYAKKVGIPYINVDLMLGIQWQTKKSFLKDLLSIIKLEVDMIHLHPFVGTSRVIDEDADAETKMLQQEMNDVWYRILQQHGYWDNDDDASSLDPNAKNKQLSDAVNLGKYLWIGVGAVWFSGDFRYINTQSMDEYYKKLDAWNTPTCFISQLKQRDNMIQYVVYKMRYGTILLDDFFKHFWTHIHQEFQEALSELQQENVVTLHDDRVEFSFESVDDYQIYSKYFYDPLLLCEFRKKYTSTSDSWNIQ